LFIAPIYNSSISERHSPKKANPGVMEYWSDGKNIQYSSTPTLQKSDALCGVILLV
jgi:hypothetical protein